jgi:hypothetical protein
VETERKMGEMSKGETPTHNSGKGGMRSLIIAVLVLLAVLIGVIIFLVVRLNTQNKAVVEEPKEKKGVILPENVDEVMSEWLEEPEVYVPKNFTVVQNSDWTFPDGNSESTDAYVENDIENDTAFYFDVVLDSTGELVYSSPILELGAKIEKFKLDKPVEAGDYDCTITYHLVDENQKELTTVTVGTTIKVLN